MSENGENKSTSKLSVLEQWKKQKLAGKKINKLEKRPAQSIAIASKGQKRIWLLQQLNPNNTFYQYAHLYELSGKLEIDHLLQSFRLLAARHKILRSNFSENNKNIELVVKEKFNLDYQFHDLSAYETKKDFSVVEKTIQDFTNLTFDLEKDILFRVCLIKKSETKYLLVFSIHHIIGDRDSLLIINRELWGMYHALVKSEDFSAKELSIQYEDFAHWQNKLKTSKKIKDYWKNKLQEELPILELPTSHERPKIINYKGAVLKHLLPKNLSEEILTFSKQSDTTPFAFLLSAFKILLHKYSHQKDLIVGTPISIKENKELHHLIGFFNETIAIRSKVIPSEKFLDYLMEVKATLLDGLDHRKMPFDELLQIIEVKREQSIHPVFQVMFLYNKASSENYSSEQLQVEDKMIDLGVSKFDLTLFVNERAEGLELALEYATEIFDENLASQMLRHLNNILSEVIQNPQQKISSLELLDTEEKEQIVTGWNQNKYNTPSYNSISEFIFSDMNKRRDNIAVSFLDNQISYEELDKKSTSIANAIVAANTNHEIVGLYAQRSLEMIIGILGILKAGKAYLPLDPSYPEERISYMVSDAKVELVLAPDATKTPKNPSVKILLISDADKYNSENTKLLPKVTLEDLAYVIYTSGSTGKPKGVPITHGNLIHSTYSRTIFYPENPAAFLLLSSFSFDSSIVGIFWTLSTGGNLVLPVQRIEQDVEQLSNLIAQHSISHMLLLPSLYSTILSLSDKKKIKVLKNVMVAGEACSLKLIEQHYSTLENTILYNEYGPTEASVWCIAHELKPAEKVYVPIGKAIPNTDIYILDESLNVCPPFVSGEIHVGGPGLSKGYLYRQHLTDEKFIPNPFSANTKLYKTGDLGRYNTQGLIEFLGRVDNQVKIRGHRIELSEIENVLKDYIDNESIISVYQAEKNNRKLLVAYYVKNETIQESEIISYLREQLPAYMVPASYIALEKFPRLPNGKINRHNLPIPTSDNKLHSNEYTAPINLLELQLVQIWEEIIDQKHISRHDNFFEIGGDSILSIQIVSRARDEGISLKPNEIFEYQTIALLAENISKNNKETFLSIEDISIHNHYKLSPIQRAFLFNYNASGTDAGELLLSFNIEGLLDIELFTTAWEKISYIHPVLRTYIVETEGQIAEQHISSDKKIDIKYLDYSQYTTVQQDEKTEKVKKKLSSTKTALFQYPTYELVVVKKEIEQYILFWKCHHLLVDGWSCGIIIKDLLKTYEQLSKEKKTKVKKSINFPSYLAWKEEEKHDAQNIYWKNKLKDFKTPLLFGGTTEIETYRDLKLSFSKIESQRIKERCSKLHITQSTFFQAIFSIILGNIFQTEDIVFGLTVTGRNQNFPEIETICGLFMNTIPTRIKLNKKELLADWLQGIQKNLGEQNTHESHTLHNIRRSIAWPSQFPLFDALFVFGNFLEEDYKLGDLKILSFTGGFSSNYPLTIRVNPTNKINIDLRYNSAIVNEEVANYLDNNFYKLGKLLSEYSEKSTLEEVKEKITENKQLHLVKTKDISSIKNRPLLKKSEIKKGRNKSEIALIAIWEKLFNLKPISREDNFFNLGGNSIMALQLFSTIEKQLGEVIAPAVLYKNPTIEDLAEILDGENLSTEEIIIPLKKEGNQPPLFCIHGGGAHVFFYQDLSNNIHRDIPMYSIQPKGLDGKSSKHLSIVEMATDYIKEIKLIQASGPYHLLGTCFSNAVALEMTKQLIAAGDTIGNLFIIDSAPVHLFGNDEEGKSKTMTRFLDMLKRGDFQRIKSKLQRRFSSTTKRSVEKVKKPLNTNEIHLQASIDMLNKLYADYSWEPVDTSIHFIRSSEFHKRSDKKYHLTQWNKLAKKGVSTHVVEGHHISLFQEPEVQGLSRKISKCLLSTK